MLFEQSKETAMNKNDIKVGKKYSDLLGNERKITGMWNNLSHKNSSIVFYEITKSRRNNGNTKVGKISSCTLLTFSHWARREEK